MAQVITTISPNNGEPLTTRSHASPAEMLAIGEAAQTAFRSYAEHTTLEQRKAIVNGALGVLAARKSDLARDLTAQMGRPIAYGEKEVMTTIARAQYLMRVSEEQLATTPGDPEPGFQRYIEKKPVGVVLIIFPWNYPFMTLINSLVPALLAGNAVILKPSPQTPMVADAFVEAFQAAKLPENVLQVFHCHARNDMAPLIQSPLVNHICFTGSTEGGFDMQKMAANRIVSVGLELGGNDAAYVRPDVDPAWVAEEVVDGAIFNSGQSCCAIERVFVHADIYDAFLAAVKSVLRAYRVGDPFHPQTQIGPVVSAAAKAKVGEHVADALKKGARDETPQVAPEVEESTAKGNENGFFVNPVLLTGTTPEMAVMAEETFGPVIPVVKVGSDEEAVSLINNSDLGLTASVWTRDSNAAQQLTQKIEAGTVFVNRSDYLSPDLAWTGWKNSGRGVTLSKFGFDQFVKLKSFHFKECPK